MKISRLKKIVFILVITITSIICAIFFSEQQSEKQMALSQTIRPQIASIYQKKMISGNLFPIKEIEVKSAVSGILEKYYVTIGEVINTGEQIAKIKMLPEPSQLENARKNLNTAFITLKYDMSNYKRDSILFEKAVIARSELEETYRVYQISREQYESAKNLFLLLEEGAIPKSNISNIITATTSGIITELPLEEGMAVSERNNFREGSTIALIAQQDSFIFKGKVIEKDILTLKKGMKIRVTPISQNHLFIDAIVQKISSKGHIEQNVMKYDIEATFPLAEKDLIYSGFNAVAEFSINEKQNILTVPDEVVFFEHDSTFVFLYIDGVIQKRHIEVGLSDGLKTEVIKGLNLNDRILKRSSFLKH